MNIKSKFTVISGVIALSMVAFSAQANEGTVNFKGAVIDAPCGITPETIDQTVDFGMITTVDLESGGLIGKQDFKIELVNCDTTALVGKTVDVTFNGATVASAPTELGTVGGTGTAIVISSADGSDVTFGTPTSAQVIGDGSNSLLFSAAVKKATGGTVAEGDFTAVSNFTLAYQ